MMLLRSTLLIIPGGLLLVWGNRLIHTSLSGGSPTLLAVGVIVAGIGVVFALGGIAVGVRALREL